MSDRTLDFDFDATTCDLRPGGSSSYFNFVEKKTEEDCVNTSGRATESANMGKDAFVVKVMDEETTKELKLKYFS